MDIQFPPFLQKGDKVVIVSPSSKIDKQFLKGAKKRIESWGVKVSEKRICFVAFVNGTSSCGRAGG